MKISHRNMAIILMGVVAMSMSGVYSLTQNTQTTQTSSGVNEVPLVLGHVLVVAKDQNGNIKAYRQTDNLVVSNGLNATSNALFGTTQSTTATVGKFQLVGVGTGTTAAAYTQTNLVTQRGNHHTGTVTNIQSSGGTGMGAQIQASWAAGALANATSTSASIQEAGLFDGVNGTNMYARQVISPAISIGTQDTLTVTWQITFSHS